MINSKIFLIHIGLIGGLVLLALRFGKETLFAFLALLVVAMNLFVSKQINLFGLSVTASDSLAVGYLLGLNLIQEAYGKEQAKKCILLSFVTALFFCCISLIHIAYTPNTYDSTQSAFLLILGPSFRIFLASLATFFIVQFVDLRFFSFLRAKTAGKFLPARITCSLILSEFLDTALFTILGLWGSVHSPFQVAIFCFIIKLGSIILFIPFSIIAKKMINNAALPV